MKSWQTKADLGFWMFTEQAFHWLWYEKHSGYTRTRLVRSLHGHIMERLYFAFALKKKLLPDDLPQNTVYLTAWKEKSVW